LLDMQKQTVKRTVPFSSRVLYLNTNNLLFISKLNDK